MPYSSAGNNEIGNTQFLTGMSHRPSMIGIDRRSFCKMACAGVIGLNSLLHSMCSRENTEVLYGIKPIGGTWFSIQYPDLRHKYMDPYLAVFSSEQIKQKIFEFAELGMDVLVLNAVTLLKKSFYDSSIFPRWDLECENPVETILEAGNETNVKIFLTCEYPNDENDSITEKETMRIRLKVMQEIVQQFSHHASFYGWYFAREAYLDPVFNENFIAYFKTLATEARQLTPEAKILIAPYGTRKGTFDDSYVRQLDDMLVDMIAYQDELGCVRPGVNTDTIASQFEKARKAHDQNGRIALWADVETFTWERGVNDTKSALVPAAFPRILRQLKAVSPYVDKILVYTAQGIIEKPDSPAKMGHPDAPHLYRCYREFLDRTTDKRLLMRSIRGDLSHDGIGKSVRFKHEPSPLYAKGKLTDGLFPMPDYKDEGWLGFYKTDVGAIIDMGKATRIRKLAIYFLQFRPAGIDIPYNIRFEISDDGLLFTAVDRVVPHIWMNTEYDSWTDLLISRDLDVYARYVRVRAACPIEWIFLGEIVVNPRI